MRTVLTYCEQNCKPGSVFDSHLSRRAVANALQPPRERPGQPVCSHTGVAPDRVYSDGHSRAVGCALTAPFHPYLVGTSSISFTPPQAAGFTHFAVPPLPTKTAFLRGPHFVTGEAVYLCCTFPEVAFGGRYPLSLPCGARTFLMDGLSACPRGCLFSSRLLFYRSQEKKSTNFKGRPDVSWCLLRSCFRETRAIRRAFRVPPSPEARGTGTPAPAACGTSAPHPPRSAGGRKNASRRL